MSKTLTLLRGQKNWIVFSLNKLMGIGEAYKLAIMKWKSKLEGDSTIILSNLELPNSQRPKFISQLKL